MEDRTTPGLYLELGDCPRTDTGGAPKRWRLGAGSTGSRGGELRARRQDVHAGRRRSMRPWPRWRRPSPRRGTRPTTVHCFRRDQHPSQVSSRDGRRRASWWCGSARVPELAQSCATGDFVHIRHIAATGYPASPISVYENVAPVDPMSMHFYELDGDDAEATFSTMIDYVARRVGGVDSETFTAWADGQRDTAGCSSATPSSSSVSGLKWSRLSRIWTISGSVGSR